LEEATSYAKADHEDYKNGQQLPEGKLEDQRWIINQQSKMKIYLMI
jgi:hypothetical protein